jgi:hypothetical protein
MIRFKCPKCSKEISVNDDLAGRKGKCPGCGQMLQVPDSPALSQPVQPPVAVAPPPAPVHTVSVQATPAYSPTATVHTPATAVQVNVNQSFAAHSLGVSSLVLGVLSFFVCWIPFIGMPLSGLGILLGVGGLVMAVARKGSGIGYSIAGSVVNAFGFFMAFAFMTVVSGMFNAVDSAMNEIAKPPKQATPVVQAAPVVTALPNGGETTETNPQPISSTETPIETKQPPAPAAPAWTAADTPLQLGNVQVRITKVTVGKVPLHREIVDKDGVSEDELLAVWLEIRNTSERKKIDYRGWMDDYSSLLDVDAEMTDDVENRYRAIRFSATLKVKDTETNTSIYPGKSIKDAVVFEKPIEGVQFLRLKLSAKGCGENGEFRFEIPKEMIRAE